jgi:hypothetical protein
MIRFQSLCQSALFQIHYMFHNLSVTAIQVYSKDCAVISIVVTESIRGPMRLQVKAELQ